MVKFRIVIKVKLYRILRLGVSRLFEHYAREITHIFFKSHITTSHNIYYGK